MYHVLLTNRYLTTRIIPLIAVAAVALCVALVIIVVSVMTGFLDMVKSSGRTLMGDVVVSYSVSGLPYYDRLIDAIERTPEAAAATPVIDGWGLLKMPYPMGPDKETETVQFWGVDPAGLARVSEYDETLYWRPLEDGERGDLSDVDFRADLADEFGAERLERILDEGRRLERMRPDGTVVPGAVLGMHVSIGNERQRDGSYRPILGPDGYWWMPRYEIILTALPVDTRASPEPESARLQVVNEFVSGVFLIDDKRIIVPIETAQRLLHLDRQEIVDDEGETVGVDPPRATTILVRAADGVTPDELRDVVSGAYATYLEELRADADVLPEVLPPPEYRGVRVQTWLQQQAQFIAPVEKERELMRVLFSIIYLVCAGLVLSIFWAIVYEKTRDIGILRSVGASRLGISFIFLRYGAIIGGVGGGLGLGLAWVIVTNINAIHTAMGEPVPRVLWGVAILAALATLVVAVIRRRSGLLTPVVTWALVTVTVLGAAIGMMVHRGTLIWDPSVYYFSEIPNELDVTTAVTTLIGAVVFSVVGAFFPAAKAADTDPVRALRYE